MRSHSQLQKIKVPIAQFAMTYIFWVQSSCDVFGTLVTLSLLVSSLLWFVLMPRWPLNPACFLVREAHARVATNVVKGVGSTFVYGILKICHLLQISNLSTRTWSLVRSLVLVSLMFLDLSLKLVDVWSILCIRSCFQPIVRLLLNLHFNDPGEEGDKNGCQDDRLEDGPEGVDVDRVVVEVQPGGLLHPLSEVVIADQLL